MNSTKNIFQGLFLAGLLSFGLSYTASAQSFNTTRGLGMGGTGTATVTGFQSNFVNPANLAIPQRTKWSIGIIGGLNPDAGGGLANISLYNEYFTQGTTITPELNMQIADRWFGSSGNTYKEMGFNVDIVPFGISYQRNDWAVSLATRVRVLGNIGMSRGVFLTSTGINSATFGTPQQFDIGNETVAFAEISAGYAQKVWENNTQNAPGTMRVYAGVAPKFLVPMHYHSVDVQSQMRVQDSPYLITHDFTYEIKAVGQFAEDMRRFQQERQTTGQAPKVDGYFDDSFNDFGELRGSGLGIDLGATFEYYLDELPFQSWATKGMHRLRGSISVTDIGSMNMSNSAKRFYHSDVFIWDGFDVNQNRLNEDYDSDFGAYFNNVIADSIGNEIYMNLNAEELSAHKVGLPGMFNMGVAYDVGKLTFALDTGAGFNNRGTNSTKMYLALGTEFRPVNYLPIRVGMKTGGNSSTAFTAGTGVNLRNFEFTFSVLSVPNSTKYGTAIASAFSGFIIRF
ncbi:MAG: DUF5723 family protein [Balneolales bacterium]|nr:DUF5723 family protein [Balneolales bacterium]